MLTKTFANASFSFPANHHPFYPRELCKLENERQIALAFKARDRWEQEKLLSLGKSKVCYPMIHRSFEANAVYLRDLGLSDALIAQHIPGDAKWFNPIIEPVLASIRNII